MLSFKLATRTSDVKSAGETAPTAEGSPRGSPAAATRFLRDLSDRFFHTFQHSKEAMSSPVDVALTASASPGSSVQVRPPFSSRDANQLTPDKRTRCVAPLMIDGSSASAKIMAQLQKQSGVENSPLSYHEILPNRLVFMPYLAPGGVNSAFASGEDNKNLVVISIDDVLLYEPFHLDFGPLNLACVHRYCAMLHEHLTAETYTDALIIHASGGDGKKRANAAFLAGAFCLAVLKWPLQRVLDWLAPVSTSLVAYRDATYGACSFRLYVADCLSGLSKAISLNWYDFGTFDLATYEYYDRLENGDLHWLIPNEFIAFSGPEEYGDQLYTPSCNVAAYARLFKSFGVKLVVRLNKEQYDKKVFLAAGIDHKDLYFVDGGVPPPAVLQAFLQMAHLHPKPIAVHCKAGLGRTGTLIGCYAMQKYGFTARQWVGWNRIARPGSVLGPQQYFLCEMERELRAAKKVTAPQAASFEVVAHKLGEAIGLKARDEYSDRGQGERLINARIRSSAATGCTPSTLQTTACEFTPEATAGAPASQIDAWKHPQRSKLTTTTSTTT